jgi:alpha-N-acetylglucosamine transferase
MLAESLHRLGARPDTLILYATDLAADSQANASSARLLQQATQMYGARVQPVAVLNSPSSKLDTMWSQGFTKLLAFNQTRYKRVLSLDSDATLLQPMDELFLLPAESKVAMPRAYWLEDKLCAAVMLASPSGTEFGRIQARLAESQPEGYDMEIINALYGDSCLVFPHKPYLLLTGEMRSKSHEAYLGSKEEPWDVDSVIKQAKYIHFSDYPLPKPWVGASETMKSDLMTSCKASGTKAGGVDCSDREAWLWLYKEFRERRKRVCGPEFADLERVEQYLAELPPMAKGLADAEG